MRISIRCDGTLYLDYKEIKEYQEEIKTITRANIEKLKLSILTDGFKAPPFVWKYQEEYYYLDGHQRKKALTELEREGNEIPRIPCVEIFADSHEEAKQNVLLFTSQHGEFDNEALQLYIEKYKINTERIVLRRNEIKLRKIKEEIYTKKIEPPIYEITGEKPKVTELYDNKKTMEMINKIDESGLPEKEKQFLRLAASRHIVFNYANIAEYYAHSEQEAQELMEDSALVIIDFNKAIEQGYVQLSEKIADQYRLEDD